MLSGANHVFHILKYGVCSATYEIPNERFVVGFIAALIA